MGVTSTIWTLLCVAQIQVATALDTEVMVGSSFGEMIGLVNDAVTFGGESRYGTRFLGIPFAKPPTGSRRFEKPEPETMLSNRYNATYYRPVCPQVPSNIEMLDSLIQDEDCLYLNLFLPGSTVSSNNSFPVMMWIYGGGFMIGQADLYHADILSSFNDVIVVTFNYRINVLGFLDDGSGSFANNGLHDQKLAIDWVHNHIQSFGGDPSRVTLFGESAGSVSVIYQGLHTDNQGKIHRLIGQSGSPLSPFAYEASPGSVFANYVSYLNCSRRFTNDSMGCLRNKTIIDMINALASGVSFSPTIDGDFLHMDPSSLFANYSRNTSESLRAFSDLDFLSGYNNRDGGSIVVTTWAGILQNSGIDISNGVPRQIFESAFVPSTLNLTFGEKYNDALLRATINEYIDWFDSDNGVMVRGAMMDLSTDFVFLVPAVQAAKKHADIAVNKSSYLFMYSHKTASLPPAWLDGALHTWEISYVFGLTSILLVTRGLPEAAVATLPEADINLSLAMMKYWTNFAKTGYIGLTLF